MAHELQYTSDNTGSVEKAQGSDNRLNVSSRQDSRSYYNSRDQSQTFTLLWDDASSAAGDFVAYWKNTDTTGKVLVIDAVGVNSLANAASFKLHRVTGTATGAAVTPFCSNQAVAKDANAVGVEAAGTAISGLTSAGVFDHVLCPADGHEEMRLDDRVRVGQGQAVAIEFEQGTTSRTIGVIWGYYE